MRNRKRIVYRDCECRIRREAHLRRGGSYQLTFLVRRIKPDARKLARSMKKCR